MKMFFKPQIDILLVIQSLESPWGTLYISSNHLVS